MVIVSGMALVSVICLSAKDFGGSGKNKTTGNADKKLSVTESDTEDDDTDANAVVQNLLFSYGSTSEDENSKELLAYKSISEMISKNGRTLEELPTASIVPVSTELLGEKQHISEENSVDYKKDEVNAETTSEVGKETNGESQTQMHTEAQTEIQTEQKTEPQTDIQIETENQVMYSPIDIEISDTDYYWLIRIVEAEAGDQDEIGRILVANVIFNRIKSGKFPTTVKSVIFQNNGKTYQFEPVKNERIYDVTPSETTINCVDRAINGEDYSNGALFFTMKTSSGSWFNTSLTLLFVHGDHYFYTY